MSQRCQKLISNLQSYLMFQSPNCLELQLGIIAPDLFLFSNLQTFSKMTIIVYCEETKWKNLNENNNTHQKMGKCDSSSQITLEIES